MVCSDGELVLFFSFPIYVSGFQSQSCLSPISPQLTAFGNASPDFIPKSQPEVLPPLFTSAFSFAALCLLRLSSKQSTTPTPQTNPYYTNRKNSSKNTAASVGRRLPSRATAQPQPTSLCRPNGLRAWRRSVTVANLLSRRTTTTKGRIVDPLLCHSTTKRKKKPTSTTFLVRLISTRVRRSQLAHQVFVDLRQTAPTTATWPCPRAALSTLLPASQPANVVLYPKAIRSPDSQYHPQETLLRLLPSLMAHATSTVSVSLMSIHYLVVYSRPTSSYIANSYFMR